MSIEHDIVKVRDWPRDKQIGNAILRARYFQKNRQDTEYFMPMYYDELLLILDMAEEYHNLLNPIDNPPLTERKLEPDL